MEECHRLRRSTNFGMGIFSIRKGTYATATSYSANITITTHIEDWKDHRTERTGERRSSRRHRSSTIMSLVVCCMISTTDHRVLKRVLASTAANGVMINVFDLNGAIFQWFVYVFLTWDAGLLKGLIIVYPVTVLFEMLSIGLVASYRPERLISAAYTVRAVSLTAIACLWPIRPGWRWSSFSRRISAMCSAFTHVGRRSSTMSCRRHRADAYSGSHELGRMASLFSPW